MVLPHHAGKFLPKLKGFFHPDSFSRGGECHRPWYWRELSQLKWRDLLKASRWSKQQWSTPVTRSHSHSNSDGSEIQVH
jgi:hypothetical protein